MTHQEFINYCLLIHGNKFDYSNSKYINHGTKIIVSCNTCGHIWNVRPLHHIGKSKSGCPNCANLSRRNKKTKSLEKFINEANIIHKDKYDYSQAKYLKNNEKINILCPSHGLFRQTPSVHLKGFGCNFCSGYQTEKSIESEYNLYKKLVWSETNKSYRKHKSLINPQNIERSRRFHLDHKFSIHDGFKSGILPSIIGHYHNLEILPASKNREKWSGSSINLEELLILTNLI